jgi:hypothetical protein
VTSRCLAFTVLLLLAGCGGAARVVDLPTGNIYRDQDLGGEFPVVVLGNPFAGVSQEALTQRVVAVMPGGFGYGTQFVPSPPGAPPPVRRVVWVFGPGVGGGDGSAVCQSQGSAPAPTAEIRAYAAVCRGPSALSAVQADVSGVRAPDDPGFRDLIRTATTELFNRQPQQDRGRGLFR